MSSAIIVMAKAPVAGRAKTRLCPPCTAEEAAALALAALEDTLAAAGACRATRRIVALDGEPGAWLSPGFEVVHQRGDGLAARLAAAFEDAGGPGLAIGMDTPQVTADLLDLGLEALDERDAAFGPASDGGYWALGLRRPDARVFDGVPMSDARTGAVQRARLAALGLSVASLPALRDVDTMEDARAVAAEAPHGRFAAALAERLR